MMPILPRLAATVREEYFRNTSKQVTMEITRGVRGAITGKLNRLGGSDSARYMVLGWLTDAGRPIRSSALEPWQWEALYSWIGFHEAEGGWDISPTFLPELQSVLIAAYKEFGNPADTVIDEQLENYAKGATPDKE